MVKTQVTSTKAEAKVKAKNLNHFDILSEMAQQLGIAFEADKDICSNGFTEYLGPNYIVIRSTSSNNIALIDQYLLEKCKIIAAKDANQIFIKLS